MTAARIYETVRKFNVGEIIELYKIDLTKQGGVIYYMTNNVMEERIPISFGGIEYAYMPLAMDDIEVDAQAAPPQPRLSIATAGGPVTAIIEANNQLRGAEVTQFFTFAEFLDKKPSGTGGAEVIPNGDLSSSTGWITGTGVSIAGGQATCTYTTTILSRAGALRVGVPVTIKVEIKSVTAGINIRVGNSLSNGVNTKGVVPATVGVKTFSFTPTTTDFSIEADGTQFSGVIDNISVVEDAAIPNPTADGTAIVQSELFIIDRLEGSDNREAQFLCVAPTDIEGAMLPRRIVRKRWCDAMYRVYNPTTDSFATFEPVDGGCPYRGTAYFDRYNQPTTKANDRCPKTMQGCLRRYGYQNAQGNWVSNVAMPAQMFPGVRATQEA